MKNPALETATTESRALKFCAMDFSGPEQPCRPSELSESPDGELPPRPLVAVIVPVHNLEPYLQTEIVAKL